MVEKPARILVVDDNEDDHVHLRRLLRSEFQVVAAYSAAEALERARSEAFDALIELTLQEDAENGGTR